MTKSLPVNLGHRCINQSVATVRHSGRQYQVCHNWKLKIKKESSNAVKSGMACSVDLRCWQLMFHRRSGSDWDVVVRHPFLWNETCSSTLSGLSVWMAWRGILIAVRKTTSSMASSCQFFLLLPHILACGNTAVAWSLANDLQKLTGLTALITFTVSAKSRQLPEIFRSFSPLYQYTLHLLSRFSCYRAAWILHHKQPHTFYTTAPEQALISHVLTRRSALANTPIDWSI